MENEEFAKLMNIKKEGYRVEIRKINNENLMNSQRILSYLSKYT